MSEPTRVVVAVLTFRRRDDLAEVLPLLLREAASTSTQGSVLVVDNDPEGSARTVAERHPEVGYVVEPHAGIAPARNRALREAQERGADFLAFIDDDERPDEGWLAALLSTQQAHGAQAVAGPVTSHLPAGTDPWIERGEFFARRHRHHLVTGDTITEAATNNLLLDLAFVAEHELSFDERLGLTGGEDSQFTQMLVAAGGRMVWCAEARVHEDVPPARATRSWVLRRALRYGTTQVVLDEARAPSRVGRTRAIAAARGGARVLVGLARAGWGLVSRDQHAHARGLHTAARGSGMLLGAAGLEYHEYGRRGVRIVRRSSSREGK